MNESNSTVPPIPLFIYGTLKRGHCRAPMLARQRFLKTAQTKPIYQLVNCGSYPGLVPAPPGQGRSVEGELWEVDQACLALLDKEEGVDAALYCRALIELEDVELEDVATGRSLRVEGYLYLRDTSSMADVGTCWTLEFEQRVLGRY